MKEPTQEQVKEFWEWCGFTRLEQFGGSWHQRLEPGLLLALPIDLNNLFNYAVPKLKRWRIANYPSGEMSQYGLTRVFVTTGDWDGLAEDKEPAIALFWAIYRMIKGGA